jgi:phosphoserine phosphatase RsbX
MEAMTATAEAAVPVLVEWGVAARALPGETESGDLHLVASSPNRVLIAVADGLGHGPEAAAAARLAMRSLRERPQDCVLDLVRRCHTALHRTRGVVLSLASIDAQTNRMTWLGVGDVDATLFRAGPAAQPNREALARRSGVVGYQLPRLHAPAVPIARGDVLVFATDGISSDFHAEWRLDAHPQDAAEHIIGRYGKGTDDALVLVARYMGIPS